MRCSRSRDRSSDREATAPEIGLPQIPGYEILEVLGRGGVGVVYKAVHLRLNRTVALKMLLAGAFATRAERQRFAREAEVVARLRHPNIVQVYDVGDLDGRPYFTMEFVEGGSLAEMIAGTPRPARQAAELMATLADAIEAAHRGGIVHRDLKPSNVLLTADGTPKIGDFGLARHLEVGPSLTQSGAAVGTPSYMAPEQARGKSGEAGPAADLYALGAVLYELLTGRPPFRAESAAETLHQVITRDPVPPSRLNAKVPRDLETICLKCLRKDPQLRYADAAALAEDLRRFLRGEAIAARPENWLQRLARRVRRRPAFSAVDRGRHAAGDDAGRRRALADRPSGRRRCVPPRMHDLREMARWLEKSSWPEAAPPWSGRGAGWAIAGVARPPPPPGAGRPRSGAGARAWTPSASTTTGHEPGGLAASSDRTQEYEAAFRRGRARAGPRRPGAVAATDQGVEHPGRPGGHARRTGPRLAQEHRRRDWLLAVARLADQDPTGWRDRARDPATAEDGAALARLDRGRPGRRAVRAIAPVARQSSEAVGEGPGPVPEADPAGAPRRLLGQSRAGRALLSEGPRRGDPLLPGGAGHPAGGGRRPQQPRRRRWCGSAGSRRPSSNTGGRADRPDGRPFLRNLAITLPASAGTTRRSSRCRIALRARPEVAVLHCTLGFSLEARAGMTRPSRSSDGPRRSTRDSRRHSLACGTTCSGRDALDEARVAWRRGPRSRPARARRLVRLRRALPLPRAGGRVPPRPAGLAREVRREHRPAHRRADRAGLPAPARARRTSCGQIRRPRRAGLGRRSARNTRRPTRTSCSSGAWRNTARGGRTRRSPSMRGDASRVLGPAPRLVLAMALHRSGRGGGGPEALAAAVRVPRLAGRPGKAIRTAGSSTPSAARPRA